MCLTILGQSFAFALPSIWIIIAIFTIKAFEVTKQFLQGVRLLIILITEIANITQVVVSYINFSKYCQVLGVEMSTTYNKNNLVGQPFYIKK